MININAQTCDEAWRAAAKLVRDQGLAQESRTFRSADVTTETLELLHAGMTIADPRQRIVFSRPINPAFAIAEVIWILAGSNDLNFIAFWNPLMKQFSDDGKTLHGAYGWRLAGNVAGEYDGPYFVPARLPFNQLQQAYSALSATPHSRQVVLQIYNVADDFPFSNGLPRSKDIPCNLIADLKVRDGKLHWQQVMRSNDLFWGTPYNFIQWCSLQEIVAGWLGLEVGQYTHIASSLHVYQDHWNELREMEFNGDTKVIVDLGNGIKQVEYKSLPSNEADLRIEGYDNWLPVFKTVLQAAVDLTRAKHSQTVYDINDDLHEDLGLPLWFRYADEPAVGVRAYAQWVALLSAEVCRKLGQHEDALDLINYAGAYYKNSWLQWYARKEVNNG